MELHFLIAILIFINAYASRVVNFVFKCFPIEKQIAMLTLEIDRGKNNLDKLSMMDDFANYARQRRKLNTLKDERTALVKNRSLRQGQQIFICKSLIRAATSLTLILLVLIYRSQIVIEYPPDVIWPMSHVFSLLGAPPGAISVPLWTVMTSSVAKTISKHF